MLSTLIGSPSIEYKVSSDATSDKTLFNLKITNFVASPS